MIVGTNFLGHNSNNFQFEKKYPVDIARFATKNQKKFPADLIFICEKADVLLDGGK